jgi:hypothetical protein
MQLITHSVFRLPTPPFSLVLLQLDANPVDADNNIPALLLGAVPLIAESSVLLRVPEGADSAVHAAAAGSGAA